MIIARAPMRISFVGGGTDLADFYRMSPGRVISATIDKYVYVAINRTPLIKKVSARYSITEMVDHPSELKNHRIRAALLDLGIHNNIEVGTFSHLPGQTGLGSSSSFAVALMKGLFAVSGRKIDRLEAAEAACRLEIVLLEEPIGKQDQYAAAFGGFNVFQFNADDSVAVEPVLLDYKKRLGLEKHILVFFTGITRPVAAVLNEQKANIPSKTDTLKEMADSVYEFKRSLLEGDFAGLGRMLNEGWLKKKTLASGVSNAVIDSLYQAGMANGAWGGKVLGAGGGGCVMFLAPQERKDEIRKAVREAAVKIGLSDFDEIPIKFVQSGVEILINSGQFGPIATV